MTAGAVLWTNDGRMPEPHEIDRPRVTQVPDLVYASPDGVALRADLFLPAAVAGPPPVILWLHGGGWRYGSRKVAPDLPRFFAARGFAMAAVDYRLSQRACFPAQIVDVKTAIRWLHTVAARYGFDAERLGLWGVSAGGHLAALAALTDSDVFTPPGALYGDRPCTVQAVAAGYPPIDFLQLDRYRPPAGTASADPETLLLPRPDMRASDADSFESLLLGAPIESCPSRVHDANPLSYLPRAAPPFLILHGLADTTIAPQQSELLFDALASGGADATLCLIEGLGHGFLNRTHLDDGPLRTMVVRRRLADGREERRERREPIFPVIEAFFRAALRHPA